MTIIVKKPFEPEPEGIKDINTKDINDTNKQQIHPEFEEKPVVESTTQTSEDVHGGSELTFSIDSTQSSGREQRQNGSYVNNQANQDTQGNTPAPNADTNNNAADDNKGAQENADGEKPNDDNALGSNADINNSDVDINTNDQGTQEPQSTTNDVDAQPQDGNDEPGSSDGDTDSANVDDDEVGGAQEQGNERENEQNSESDEDEESESEDEDEQSQSGVYNTQQVVDVNADSDNTFNAKYYKTEFYRFIELISEVKTRIFDPMGSEEFNIKKLMFRQFEKKPLNSYKMRRVREAVVILLDNSGSMEWWSDNLQVLAELAMRGNDVEIYLAPNGHIEEMIFPKRQLVNHDEIMKKLRNRKIIYVGDFDGANTPIILSWYNDVIWICPEERYIRFLEHDWVHYDESRYEGTFLRIFTLQELFSAFKKLLSAPTLRFWYDLCNETHRCGGDEE
jgi:hypothetical protein